MKLQINSDKQVTVGPELSGFVQAEIERALERFKSQLTRVEVHLSDLNSSKPGMMDKRCLLEVRPAGKKPVSVDHVAGTVEQAVRGAASRMKRLLQTSSGKAAKQSSRGSLRAAKRAVDSGGSLEKLDRIKATLAKAASQPGTESPAKKARPAKAAVPKRTRIAPKKAAAASETTSAGGRGPEKKGIYQARRKA
jgi:Sigma 54 modulation protein / S30EA ribosomal protein